MGPFSKYNGIKFQLGNHSPRKMSEAITTQHVGTVIVNTPEGIVEQEIFAPFGVTAVNADYVRSKLQDPKASRSVEEHTPNDNHLKLGYGVAHPISKGCVLVTTPGNLVKFDGKAAEGKEFVLTQSPDIHLNFETEELTIKETPTKPTPSRGKGSR